MPENAEVLVDGSRVKLKGIDKTKGEVTIGCELCKHFSSEYLGD